jgi:CRP-like cAMP-binding protein
VNRTALKELANRLLQTHRVPGVGTGDVVDLLFEGEDLVFGDGTAICVEGAPSEELYFLTAGRVRVTVEREGGGARSLSTLDAPAMFGHMGIIDGSRRTATVRAAGDAQVIILSRRQFEHLIGLPNRTGMALRHLLLASMTRQLTAGNTRIRELIGSDVDLDPVTLPPSAIQPLGDDDDARGFASSHAGGYREPVTEEVVVEISGLLGGWSVDEEMSDTMLETGYGDDD